MKSLGERESEDKRITGDLVSSGEALSLFLIGILAFVFIGEPDVHDVIIQKLSDGCDSHEEISNG